MEMKEVDRSGAVNGDGGDWISIGDFFSEESSFDGNEQSKAELEGRAAVYDPQEYWNIHAWNLQCLAANAASKVPAQSVKRKQDGDESDPQDVMVKRLKIDASQSSAKSTTEIESSTKKPFNPYENDESAKQLDESLDDFLVRLQPSTTSPSLGSWIRIANPLSHYRPLSADVATFKQTATDHMESYLSIKATVERGNPTKIPAAITRMLKPHRDELEHTILRLAKQNGVQKGKWMLFLPPSSVDHVWASVAYNTLEGRLGCAAKVATNDEDDPLNHQRLICIYTEDFSDISDVKRVLRELKRMKLVSDKSNNSREGVIYYKCDAYTYLDITSGNEFKLRASMYNSKDLFADMRLHGEL